RACGEGGQPGDRLRLGDGRLLARGRRRVEPLELGVAADAVQLPAAEEVLHGPLAAGAPPSPALAPFGVAEVAGEGGRARGADLGERLPDLGEQVRGGGGD